MIGARSRIEKGSMRSALECAQRMVHVSMRNMVGLVLIGLFLSLSPTAGQTNRDQIDADALSTLRGHELEPQRSKVMEIASALTDVYGPRLTGSPNLKDAG